MKNKRRSHNSNPFSILRKHSQFVSQTRREYSHMERSLKILGFHVFTEPLWVALKGKGLTREDLRQLVEKHVEQMMFYAREVRERQHRMVKKAKHDQKRAERDEQEKTPKITIDPL
jgi:adenylosuccinate lyase